MKITILSSDIAFNLQLVREFLERHFTIENEIKLLQQDKSELRKGVTLILTLDSFPVVT
jgi:hypothetical protein